MTRAAAFKPEIVESSRRFDMRYLIRALLKYGASDLHLKAGRPPLFRINGKLIASKMDDLTNDQIHELVKGILSPRQFGELKEGLQIDASFEVKDAGRFRCNAFYQKGALSAAIRMVPLVVPDLSSLGLPEIVESFCQRPRGLVLVTGPTGAGKSTTLAAMVQFINRTRQAHILSIEDPIEFVYRDEKSTITQREIGVDTHSIQEALYAGLRQDPDVIVIGEMRDYKVIQATITAAETGHLVLSTLHTNDAVSSIQRILNVIPPEAQNQARIQLASSLIGVVSQQLVQRADGKGRTVVLEIMVKSPTIESLILKNEISKIPEAIEASNDYYKMQTFNQHLKQLVSQGIITEEEAIKVSVRSDELRLEFAGFNRG